LQLQENPPLFETLAVLMTLGLAAVFAFLIRSEYRARQNDKNQGESR
jgi:hypothetical protein